MTVSRKKSRMAQKKRQARRDQQIAKIAGFVILAVVVYFIANAAGTDKEIEPVDVDGEVFSSELEVVTTDSGLQYQDTVVGDGPTAEAGQKVSVHYTGWLEDGIVFDSSVDRDVPFDFNLGLGAVIKGWDEGVQGMKVGGKRILKIPADLGYGDRGAGASIPPGATLIFEIELLGITP